MLRALDKNKCTLKWRALLAKQDYVMEERVVSGLFESPARSRSRSKREQASEPEKSSKKSNRKSKKSTSESEDNEIRLRSLTRTSSSLESTSEGETKSRRKQFSIDDQLLHHAVLNELVDVCLNWLSHYSAYKSVSGSKNTAHISALYAQVLGCLAHKKYARQFRISLIFFRADSTLCHRDCCFD